MRRRIEVLFRWLNVIVIVCTLLAYISPQINPTSFWGLTFFGTGYSWLLFLNFAFIIFWISFKKWYFLLPLATILLGWNHLTTFVGFNLGQKIPATTFQIMTYNVEGLNELVHRDSIKQSRIRADFYNWMNKESGIDILCTQESGWRALISHNTQLNQTAHNQGVSIFTKFPIVEQGEIDFPKTRGNACVWADIRLPNTSIIRVYSIHLNSSGISGDTDKLIETADIQEKETWKGLRNILAKYKRAAVRRAEQAQLVKNHVNTSPHPVVICGDFNEMPVSYVYEVLKTDLKDAFQERGFGIGTTFSGSIPGLKIDFMLVDPKLNIYKHDIIKNKKYSDHYPNVSTLGIPKTNTEK